MEKNQQISPFILKPTRINNYTHLIANLRQKQSKYKDCAFGLPNHSFAKVLSKETDTLNLNDILDGFLHQKLKEKAEDYEKKANSDFLKTLTSKIKELKSENDLKVYGSKIGNLKDVENQLFLKPSVITFKDELLYDIYEYIRRNAEPLEFLQSSYLTFIRKFFLDDQLTVANNKDDIGNLVKDFVKIRFNREEFNIEVYESRYLWAEVFVLYRIGRIDIIKKLLADYELFFEFMAHKFKSSFLGFLDGRMPNFVVNLGHCDKFQSFLFGLMEERVQSDGLVVGTVEDYLWAKLVTGKKIDSEIDKFENNKVRLMIAIFTKKYKKAIDILLKSDFGVVPKFFLLRELCFEQSLDQEAVEQESSNVFDKSNRFLRGAELRSKVFPDESSETVSLMSTNEGAAVTTISIIFLNFLFNMVSKLSKNEYKVKLIEMLKNHSDYYNVIPTYIIKYSLFDLLGKRTSSIGDVEFTLDDRLSSRVLQKLKETGDKQQMIKLNHLIDDMGMVELLIEVVEEAILTEESVDQSIVEKYVNKRVSRDSEKLFNVYGFYKFYKNPTFVTLNSTIIFDQNKNLQEYRFIIEKIFYKAVEVVKKENDKLMARILFKLCGSLGLNEECVNKISKDLVTLL